MPGIAGFISTGTQQGWRPPAEPMVKAMLHEPFYSFGTLVEARLALCAGWVCHSGSFSDCLPIWNETQDVCLLFVGEHYADAVDLDQLRRHGHIFEARGASHLVHLYEELGAEFFEKLNGVFCGLLIDLRENKVILFNDRYGLGRIYYHESAEGFYFASEAKAILRVLPQLRRLDMQSLSEHFACGCVLQDRTLFSGIALLPGGSAWTFCLQQPVRKKTYFNKRTWENQSPLTETDYYEKLKTTFARILPRYLSGPEQIAVSLTGGLDSRIIMAWARCGPSTLPCYSHRGVFRECADARIARRVATVSQQPHRVVTVDGSFFSEFPALATRAVYLTDGTMDVNGAAGLYVNRIARQEIARVRMTGNYGGEILRGLVALKPAKLLNPYFNREFAGHIQDGVATLASERQGHQTSFIAFKQVPWHHYARFAMESSQLTIRSPYLDNDLVALAYRSPAAPAVTQRLAARLIAEGNPALAAFPTDRGPLGRPGTLGKIRELYQEFTFKADYAYDYGMPQWLTKLDCVFAPLRLERVFLGRHKYCHFRYWYRNQLAPFVREVLLDSRALARPYLDHRCVEQMVNAHVTGHGNYTMEIHSLLTTELMQQQMIEQNL